MDWSEHLMLAVLAGIVTALALLSIFRGIFRLISSGLLQYIFDEPIRSIICDFTIGVIFIILALFFYNKAYNG